MGDPKFYPDSVIERSANKYDALLGILTAFYEQCGYRGPHTYVGYDQRGVVVFSVHIDAHDGYEFFKQACFGKGERSLTRDLARVRVDDVDEYVVKRDLVTVDLLDDMEHYHLGNTKSSVRALGSPFHDAIRSCYAVVIEEMIIHMPLVCNFTKTLEMRTNLGDVRRVPYAFVDAKEIVEASYVKETREVVGVKSKEDKLLKFYYDGAEVCPNVGQVVKIGAYGHLDVRCMWAIIALDGLINYLASHKQEVTSFLDKYKDCIEQDSNGHLIFKVTDDLIERDAKDDDCVIVKPLLTFFEEHAGKTVRTKLWRVIQMLVVDENVDGSRELAVEWKKVRYDVAVSSFRGNSLRYNLSCGVHAAAYDLYTNGVDKGIFPFYQSYWWHTYCYIAIVTTLLSPGVADRTIGLATQMVENGIAHSCLTKPARGGSLYRAFNRLSEDSFFWCVERIRIPKEKLEVGKRYFALLKDTQHFVCIKHVSNGDVLVYDPYVGSNARKLGDMVECKEWNTCVPHLAIMDDDILTINGKVYPKDDIDVRIDLFGAAAEKERRI